MPVEFRDYSMKVSAQMKDAGKTLPHRGGARGDKPDHPHHAHEEDAIARLMEQFRR